MGQAEDNRFMDVASRIEAGTSGVRRSRLDDGGFIMVALLVAMAVSAIWLATMLPAWRQQAVRQREGDLIFRGQQYARAIALYYVNDGCTLPLSVDMLVSRHFLRKKWKDPIANDDFVPLVAGGSAGTGSGAPGTSGASSPGAQPGTGRPAGPTGPTGPAPGGQQLIGLYGVASKSTDTSIMVYQNQQQYNLWSFRYTDAMQKMGRPLNCANGNQPGGGRNNGPGNGLPGDGRGGPVGPVPPGGGRPGPGGPGNGRGGTPTAGPPPPGIGSGRGGAGS
jgi:type II secretory pathway pseudopilin PulG